MSFSLFIINIIDSMKIFYTEDCIFSAHWKLFVPHCLIFTFCLFLQQDQNHWKVRGNYIATARLPGNFEIQTDTMDFDVKYHAAKLSFKCSVNCKMSPTNNRLSKHDHCYLKFILKRNDEVIKAEDCVNRYRPQMRNGSIQSHSYDLSKPGKYRFTYEACFYLLFFSLPLCNFVRIKLVFFWYYFEILLKFVWLVRNYINCFLSSFLFS